MRTLATGWIFGRAGGDEYIPIEALPTTVHVELLKNKKIPDPFIGLHEWDVQWVGETDWVFKSSLEISENEFGAPNVDLVFDGLDTYATVKLNGTIILEANNQFVPYRVSIKNAAKVGANQLSIEFPSAYLKGKELEEKHGKLALWNGDSSRLHVRKAQYNYGWDWGPVLMTVGPWRPIHLHAYTARLSDVRVRAPVDESLKAQIHVTVTATSGVSKAEVVIKGPDGVALETTDLSLDKDGVATLSFTPDQSAVQLWYPVGYGKQPLYTCEVKLLSADGAALDSQTNKFGLRRARVVEDKLVDEEGRTFLFEVNNVRIFCGGSNWIPADSFLTTVSAERYRAWLQLMVDGNQNMVRVWGGGIYEEDVFYDICDELGLLVWQDFMFGCGQYPAYDEFLSRVVPEVEANVKRLRHHPSIVIFTGNNEDYQVAEQLKLELDYSDEKSDFRKTDFPARYIYERTLPDVVSRLSDIHYHRASPYSGYGLPTTDRQHGDLHQWNVWQGSQEPWHNWDKLSGRFVSEFGMQGYPDIRTVDYWLGGNESQRYPQSPYVVNHNKADGFERRLELYLMENFKHAFDIESYVYYTQIMQAETLASAYRLWRRNWKGPGREYTAGALVWQINDCWPVTSWAIVDYFLRPKPAYFTVKREMAPVSVGMSRKEVTSFADNHTAANFATETRIEIWGSNFTLQPIQAKLAVVAFDLDRDDDWTETFEQDVTLAPNQTTELWKGHLPGQPVRNSKSELPKNIVLSARVVSPDGTVLSRYANWPEPFKYIQFPAVGKLGLKAEIAKDGESVLLSTRKPVKGIVLDVADRSGAEVKWSDQAIDLVPNDDQVVQATGLAGRDLKLRFLGDGSA
ncbi:glycoside hydrolase family 2 protein [Auriculariales sp. MPI-PUGE-AT-0066]|nr:glycoside hydrolase family 2 protein [Auriculariales sp. MPI-PUGE-AT-0066]